ncbi:MAG: zinc-dependent metalloprotease, partial [Acidimicrobiales bacterium]
VSQPSTEAAVTRMSGPVDWGLAQRVATRIAARKQGARSYHYDTLEPDFARFTAEAEGLVAAETGLQSLSGAARSRVVDRPMWISANIDSFQRLLRPVIEKLEARGKRSRLSGVTGRVGGAELGVLLGWMSSRVLGQYDLLIIEDEDPDDQDIIYYVGPNVMALERKHAFPPEEFRLWLALHEVTHRAQFTGVPWLRKHFLGLVGETLDAVDPDPRILKEAVNRIIQARKAGEDVLGDGGLPALLASPEQREILNKISGMMSLLEGHGDITMDRAGADRIPSADRFSSTLRARRNSAKGINRLFQKIIGMEAKLNQYQAGEEFIKAVEAVGGTALVDRAWEGPENLPSMDEIRTPQLWVDRMTEGVDVAAVS